MGGGEVASDETVVVLFYRYECLGAERAARVAAEQRRLGLELRLCGRVLVAPEGINGTVQGQASAVSAYEVAVEAAVGGAIDWKRSQATGDALFPDLTVKEVPEIVGFGIQAGEPLDVRSETAVHLSPAEFHRRLAETPAENLRIIDVRNTFEYEVGHFEGARDPGMTHTAQWPRFVNKNLEDLNGKQVMLYCTGGIRCEKASAYLRRRLQESGASEDTSVFQLEGGIHRYLEAFPDGGLFRGANFVFDKRAQMRPAANETVVGRCSECSAAWDTHHGGRVCCVCRSLVLVCDSCDSNDHGEYYCADHNELRGFYFHFVDRFQAPELQRHLEDLRRRLAAEVGTNKKNRRNTLRRKIEQVETRLAALAEDPSLVDRPPPPRRCRACERPYAECPGACWGFWRDAHMWRDTPLPPADAADVNGEAEAEAATGAAVLRLPGPAGLGVEVEAPEAGSAR